MNKNPRAEYLCEKWTKWMRTRKYLGPANIKGMFAAIEGGTGEEPDGLMSPEIAAFNIAIIGTDDWKRDVFLAIYCSAIKLPVKKTADMLGTSPATMYRVSSRVADDLVRRTAMTLSEFERNQQRETI
jgi:hypothetical protein